MIAKWAAVIGLWAKNADRLVGFWPTGQVFALSRRHGICHDRI